MLWKIKTAGDLVWHLKLYITEEMKAVYQAKLILDTLMGTDEVDKAA